MTKGEVAEQARAALRSEWQGLRRVYRQELFVNGDSEPFAVVECKHTLDRIEVVRTAGQPVHQAAVGDERLQGPGQLAARASGR